MLYSERGRPIDRTPGTPESDKDIQYYPPLPEETVSVLADHSVPPSRCHASERLCSYQDESENSRKAGNLSARYKFYALPCIPYIAPLPLASWTLPRHGHQDHPSFFSPEMNAKLCRHWLRHASKSFSLLMSTL